MGLNKPQILLINSIHKPPALFRFGSMNNDPPGDGRTFSILNGRAGGS
jgi:hypothetical protein